MGERKARTRSANTYSATWKNRLKKVVEEKLNDPFIATKKGEREAAEKLKKGVEKALNDKK